MEEQEKLKTLWQKNDIRPSFSFKEPFANTETIVELLETLKRIRDRQMKQWRNLPEADKRNKEPPISNDYMGFAGDGAPIVQAMRLFDLDEDKRWRLFIFPLIGVFHLFMENFKKVNHINEEFVVFLVSQYIGKRGREATDKNVGYFINFNDPTEY
jgi:hypothetical protein